MTLQDVIEKAKEKKEDDTEPRKPLAIGVRKIELTRYELEVLKAIGHLDNPIGVEIAEEVSKNYQGGRDSSIVYSSLEKLADEGYVTHDNPEDGRSKSYSVTRRGYEKLSWVIGTWRDKGFVIMPVRNLHEMLIKGERKRKDLIDMCARGTQGWWYNEARLDILESIADKYSSREELSVSQTDLVSKNVDLVFCVDLSTGVKDHISIDGESTLCSREIYDDAEIEKISLWSLIDRDNVCKNCVRNMEGNIDILAKRLADKFVKELGTKLPGDER